MNDALRWCSRHNVWANKTLLDVCRTLTQEQLSAPTTAAFGSVIETFNHVVTSDGGFLWSLGGPLTEWVAAAQRELEKYSEPWINEDARVPVVGLDELARRIDEAGRLWESFLSSEEFDADQITIHDLGTYECPAGIVMAEVFHHGSVHREQVCAMLTGFGIEPPDIQPWGFADATGISRFVGGRTS